MQKKQQDKIYIVIPAFNEAAVLPDVIKGIKKEGFKNIIVVDDGSSDNTFEIARYYKCLPLKHLINRGKGAATQTGLDVARLMRARVVVTIDGDGQHDPKDIKNLVAPLLRNETDVVLGCRIMKRPQMPLGRIVINKLANLLIHALYGIYVSDSQSGFRAYNARANSLINTTMDRYEFESEVLLQIKNAKLKYREVPIKVKYTKYSKNKYIGMINAQSQNLTNGLNMFLKMMIKSLFS